MPENPDPIANMSPADKLLRLGTVAGISLLLVLVTIFSMRDGSGSGPARLAERDPAPQVTETPATQEPSVETADVETAPEAVAEVTDAVPEDTASENAAQTAENAPDAPLAQEVDAADVAEVAAPDADADALDADVADAGETGSGPVDLLAESALLASADVARGETLFRQCATCHQYATERNGAGPHLVGIVGRDVAGADGFRYSGAMTEAGGVWTPDRLNAWLEDPRGYIPGNRMAYPGVGAEQDRIDLIGFLAAQSGAGS